MVLYLPFTAADSDPRQEPHYCREYDDDRRWDRSRSRGSDTERDWELDERGRRAGYGPRGCEVATASVFIKVHHGGFMGWL